MSSFYETLGISKQATTDEIKKAYRSLARQHHPDRNPGDEEAAKRFKAVQEAYDVLSDPNKKAEYDRFGTATGRHKASNRKPFTSHFDDFFSNFFGGGRPVHGQNIDLQATVDFEQVRLGGEVTLHCRRHKLCEKCSGRGGEQVDCGQCNGVGHRTIRGQAMNVRTTCQGCAGSGKVFNATCDACHAGFVEGEEEPVTFYVFPGVEDGMRFVRRGEGHPCADGPPGDLTITVRVNPHAIFHRLQKGHIVVNVPVSYTQLVFGCSIEIPSPEDKVSFTLPPGTQSGTKFRLRNLGLPVFTNTKDIYQKGDLLVQVVLEVPAVVGDNHKTVLESLREIENNEPAPLRKQFMEAVDGRH